LNCTNSATDTDATETVQTDTVQWVGRFHKTIGQIVLSKLEQWFHPLVTKNTSQPLVSDSRFISH